LGLELVVGLVWGVGGGRVWLPLKAANYCGPEAAKSSRTTDRPPVRREETNFIQMWSWFIVRSKCWTKEHCLIGLVVAALPQLVKTRAKRAREEELNLCMSPCPRS